MNIPLSPEDRQFIDEQVRTGRFASAGDVVGAALERLRRADDPSTTGAGEFDPGELDALVAEGEADIARGDVVDADEVFRRLRERGAEHRQRQASPKG